MWSILIVFYVGVKCWVIMMVWMTNNRRPLLSGQTSTRRRRGKWPRPANQDNNTLRNSCVCRAWTHIFIRVKTLSNWRELSGSSVLLHRHLPSVWNLSQNSSFSVFCPSCVVQEQESVIPLWALPVYLFAFQRLTFTWKIPLNRCVEERFETSMNESFRITILLKKDFITNNDML